ncbi:glycoside hydrolase family 131 protein [Bipolaris victoriae FI3]|uniref:Glycoside hydrolase family 131 protein n=1 Tax=Bipolaris victoriae (strain FI3) TaxID=930091 RepID=W7EJA0_BIPV3|nr:glycoside hydrolase family 131 protein [Bipolaris victoriae FI3]
MFGKATLMSALLSAASAEIVWDGRFNDMTSSTDLSKWSFANPVGSYQYYIHGSGPVTDYVNLDPSFKNPADKASKQGAKITIDETSKWNGQTMLRTELIPQTKAAINQGKKFYHFSIKTSTENKPTATNEHQIAFFESHFTELKYGASGSANTKLQWHVGGVSKWDVELKPDEWHNVAYEIDFSGGSVTFWHSTGSDDLKKTAGPFTASTQSNGADFHIGTLRLPGAADAAGAEDWFFSGVYIEDGELTTKIGDGSAAAPDTPVAKPSSAAPAATPSPTPAATKPEGQTGGQAPAASPSAAPSSFATSVISTTPTPSAAPSAAPAPAPGAGSGAGAGTGSGSDAVLPKEFTIKEFVAWLRAKQGQN